MSHFNPRTREGCDGVHEPLRDGDTDISIHAPVKGATKMTMSSMTMFSLFQSTHP